MEGFGFFPLIADRGLYHGNVEAKPCDVLYFPKQCVFRNANSIFSKGLLLHLCVFKDILWKEVFINNTKMEENANRNEFLWKLNWEIEKNLEKTLSLCEENQIHFRGEEGKEGIRISYEKNVRRAEVFREFNEERKEVFSDRHEVRNGKAKNKERNRQSKRLSSLRKLSKFLQIL